MEVIRKETTAKAMRGPKRAEGRKRELGSEQGLKDTLRSSLLAVHEVYKGEAIRKLNQKLSPGLKLGAIIFYSALPLIYNIQAAFMHYVHIQCFQICPSLCIMSLP